MALAEKLSKLRALINDNLRIQRDNSDIRYISIGTALADVGSKQNHTIFARRGCGKTLLLQESARKLPDDIRPVYLNCEDFKRHSFPNALIEVLISLFREVDHNLTSWFGRKRELKDIIGQVLKKLEALQRTADTHIEEVKSTTSAENSSQLKG